MLAKDPRLVLAERIGEFRYDPYSHALFSYPWGQGALENVHGPRVWQAGVMTRIAKHLQSPLTRHTPCRIARASGHGIGKGWTLNLACDTPSGIRRWGDMQPGDLVFGVDGAPTRVTATSRYRREHYRVSFDDGSSADVSGEHEWNVRGRQERRAGRDTWRTLETQEIARLGVKRSNGAALARQWEIPVQGAAQFAASDQPVHPYFLGLWLGDGSKGVPAFYKPFPELTSRLREVSGYDVRTAADGGTNRACGITDRFTDPVFICGSHERYIPDWGKYASVEQRTELFRGLCDSDGEVNQSGSIGYASSSEKLARDVIWLARSLGFKAMMQPTVKMPMCHNPDGTKTPGRPSYRVTINSPWNPFTIEHRRAAFKPSEHRYLVRWIDSIEPLGLMDGMCIEVAAPDHLYQGPDFIVTHNSALIAMLVKWGLDTCVDTRIIITANTESQLLTKTGPEIAKWSGLAITSDWFKPTATALISTMPSKDKSWRADLVTWSVNNTEAFAGLHNQGRRIILVFDEASGIDPRVWEVALGALTDEDTEIIFLAFGNPTLNTGAFREVFGRHRALWDVEQIDSRTVEGTNKAYLNELVQTYGIESDIVRVRVLGQFPSASSMQFISTDAVEAARQRGIPIGLNTDPVIFGVDCARFGDDHSTLAIRCGRDARSRPWKRWHGVDAMTLAADLAQEAAQWKPDAIFIDAGNIGAAVVDRLRQLVPDILVVEVWFGSTKTKEAAWVGGARVRVANKRAAMWCDMRYWLDAGCIPDHQGLADDLIGPEYGFDKDQAVLLEKKEHMKARGLASPDDGDALACTFAEPVQPRALPNAMNPRNYGRGNDRYAELRGE